MFRKMQLKATKTAFRLTAALIGLGLLFSLSPAFALAQTPPGGNPPVWFKDVPVYDNAQKFELDVSALALLGINRSQYYITAYLSPDPVPTIANFYVSKLGAAGWQKETQQIPLPPDSAQIIGFDRTQNSAPQSLAVVIGSKEGLESFGLTASLASKVPAGQKIIVLLAELPTPVVRGSSTISCKPGVECQAGSYNLKVSFDRDSFNTTDQFTSTVERLDKQGGDWQLKAEAVPQRGTDATPVQFKGDFENGNAAKRTIKMEFPISGNWYVTLTLNGAAGRQVVQIPLRAEPPPALDEGIAWLIGLLPLLGFIGFGIGQWRMVTRRRRAEKQTVNIPATLQPIEEPVVSSQA